VAGGILPGHEADPGRRTNGAGICAGEEKAFFCQPLHVGGPVLAIEFSFRGVEGDRGVLPTHVIDKKEEDVGFAGEGGGEEEGRKESEDGD